MRFAPKTEAEIKAEGLIPNNTECDFEVLEAEEKQSKAGNDMIALKLRVWRPDGSTTTLRDWLVSNFPAKIFGFAKSTGMQAEYEAGEMTAEAMEGKQGRLKVKIEESADYGAQNKVGFYVMPAAPRSIRAPAEPATRGGGAKPGAKGGADLADDIPFAPETRA
jgi:hypothetical protein